MHAYAACRGLSGEQADMRAFDAAEPETAVGECLSGASRRAGLI